MPSLFSRARTASTPSKSKHKPPLPTLSTNPLPAFSSALLTGSPTVRTPVDEFGVHNLVRSRSAGGTGGASAPGEAGYGAVGFLPTTLPADPHTPWVSSPSAPPLGLSSSTSSSNSHKDAHQLFGGPIQPRAAYGLLSPARNAVLGLADAARLVGTVCAELERTGWLRPSSSRLWRSTCGGRALSVSLTLFWLLAAIPPHLMAMPRETQAPPNPNGPKKRASPAHTSSGCVSAGAYRVSCG
jgi:hypothetical protein